MTEAEEQQIITAFKSGIVLWIPDTTTAQEINTAGGGCYLLL